MTESKFASGAPEHSVAFYEAFYRSEMDLPWDLDGPTPFVVELEERGEFRGDILDAGCGTGENALYLAKRGHRVTAVDFAPTAVEKARAKAGSRGLDVTFMVADVFELAGEGRFDTVVDSGLFHIFTEADQARYSATLRRLCRPDAVVHLMCMNDDERNWGDVSWQPSRGRRGIAKELLARAFADGWTIESVRAIHMPIQAPGHGMRERHFWLARIRRRR